jgi:divalent metal cation (Fe/Co/Zn/Cd) transporter
LLGIGVVLAAIAAFLARESKSLLIGEPAEESVRHSLAAIAGENPAKACNFITVHLAPNQIVAAAEINFSNKLSAADIERSVSGPERRAKEAHLEVTAVFVKPKAGEGCQGSSVQ